MKEANKLDLVILACKELKKYCKGLLANKSTKVQKVLWVSMIAGLVILALALMLAMVYLAGFIVAWLFNATVATIFGVPAISTVTGIAIYLSLSLISSVFKK